MAYEQWRNIEVEECEMSEEVAICDCKKHTKPSPMNIDSRKWMVGNEGSDWNAQQRVASTSSI
jgi:hypothetical protein